MSRVIVVNGDGEGKEVFTPGNPGNVQIAGRKAQTIQTHNAVSIGASGSATSAYSKCEGFDKIIIRQKNDAATASSIEVYWSDDGISISGYEVFTGTPQYKKNVLEVSAAWFRVGLLNGDTIAHTMSAWAYLKA